MNIRTDIMAPEVEYFREQCNFTRQQIAIFDLRVSDHSHLGDSNSGGIKDHLLIHNAYGGMKRTRPVYVGPCSLFNALCRVFRKRSYVFPTILRTAHRRISARHIAHMSFLLRKPLLLS